MALRIIPRAEWGARHDNGAGSRTLPARHVVLHHSVTIAPDLVPPFDDDYAAIRELEQIGEDRFGRGVSYTRLFTPSGLIFEGHSIGQVGSHTAGYNVTGVGYCLIGNYETDQPTREQLLAVAWCMQHDHANGWIDAPAIDFGHSAVKATACPGQHGRAAIPVINLLAAGGPITEEEDMPTIDEYSQGVWRTKVPDWHKEGAPDMEAFVTLSSIRGDAWKTLQTAIQSQAMLAVVIANQADDVSDADVLERLRLQFDVRIDELSDQLRTEADAARAHQLEVLTELVREVVPAEFADTLLTRMSERLSPAV